MKNKIEIANAPPNLVNLPNGSRVFNGVPLRERHYGEVEVIEIPKSPHIFRARRLQFNRTVPIFDDVNIVLGHGIFVLADGLYHWCFSDGQAVSKVVEGVSLAIETSLDLVIACSGSYVDRNASPQTASFVEMPAEDLVRGLPEGVTYFYGEDIRTSSVFLDFNQILVNVSCALKNMRNEEVLAQKKSKYEYREG